MQEVSIQIFLKIKKTSKEQLNCPIDVNMSSTTKNSPAPKKKLWPDQKFIFTNKHSLFVIYHEKTNMSTNNLSKEYHLVMLNRYNLSYLLSFII